MSFLMSSHWCRKVQMPRSAFPAATDWDGRSGIHEPAYNSIMKCDIGIRRISMATLFFSQWWNNHFPWHFRQGEQGDYCRSLSSMKMWQWRLLREKTVCMVVQSLTHHSSRCENRRKSMMNPALQPSTKNASELSAAPFVVYL